MSKRVFKFIAARFGDDILFDTKDELFNHEFFQKYASTPTFTRFSLKNTADGTMVLGEYYGGTEYRILGTIVGDVSELNIPYRQQNW